MKKFRFTFVLFASLFGSTCFASDLGAFLDSQISPVKTHLVGLMKAELEKELGLDRQTVQIELASTEPSISHVFTETVDLDQYALPLGSEKIAVLSFSVVIKGVSSEAQPLVAHFSATLSSFSSIYSNDVDLNNALNTFKKVELMYSARVSPFEIDEEFSPNHD